MIRTHLDDNSMLKVPVGQQWLNDHIIDQVLDDITCGWPMHIILDMIDPVEGQIDVEQGSMLRCHESCDDVAEIWKGDDCVNYADDVVLLDFLAGITV